MEISLESVKVFKVGGVGGKGVEQGIDGVLCSVTDMLCSGPSVTDEENLRFSVYVSLGISGSRDHAPRPRP